MKYNYIKCGDCLELMKEIPDKSIDLILTDLPYGCTKNKNDKRIPFEPLWKEYERVIKDKAAIVLFAQGKFYIDLVNSNRKIFRYDIVWNKRLVTGFLNARKMPLRTHEMIAVFYKKLPTYNPQFTVGNPLHSKGENFIKKKYKNNNYSEFSGSNNDRKDSTQKFPISIISIDKIHPSVAMHPTEKPVELLMWLIKTYTNKGDIVLDSCAGSGSTCIAALKTTRKFIAFEKDSDNFLVASERIKNGE